MATKGGQGAGKHGRKDTQPYPHTKDNKGASAQSESGGRTSGAGKSPPTSAKDVSQESSDLKSREYRDAQGNVHHHTHTAGKGK